MHNFLIQDINKSIAKSLPYKGRVIDLGCGTAPYKEDILKTATEYIGVDWTGSFHEASHVNIFANLTTFLPFKSNTADTVVTFQVMEHLPEPEIFLSECYRVLKGDGQLFITVPFMWHVHEAPFDYFRYTKFGLQYLLDKNNFKNIVIRENGGFWQMWILKFNYHTYRFAKGPLKYFWIPIWWIGQKIAPLLDKYDKNPGETVSYVVSATK